MRPLVYELIGVRRLYEWTASFAHEKHLPKLGKSVEGWTVAKVTEVRGHARYFSMANICRAAVYIPHALSFWTLRYWPGLAYVAVLWVLHLVLILVEGYKSSLCGAWLATGSLPDIKEAPLKPMLTAPGWFFRPKRYETSANYSRLGIEKFRQFTVWVMSILAHGFSGKRVEFVSQLSRDGLVKFEQETRVSETVHIISALSVVPLWALTLAGAHRGMVYWSTVIVAGDLALAMLQRYHRARMWPTLSRMLERSK